MATETTAKSSVGVVEGASGVLVGAGIVTMALFPLALPFIALAVVAAIPLVLIVLAAALVVAVVATPILLLRRWRGRARVSESDHLARRHRRRPRAGTPIERSASRLA